MTSQRPGLEPAPAAAPPALGGVAPIRGEAVADEGFGPYTQRQVEEIVDRVAFFNLRVDPVRHGAGDPVRAPGVAGPVGVRTRGAVERLDIDMVPATRRAGVRVVDALSEPLGELTAEWLPIPESFHAAPGRRPPATPFDPTRSQRFALQRLECRFAGGDDGFVAFGAGRTLPTRVAGRLRLSLGACAEVIATSGRLAGHAGNLTLAGEITPDLRFDGHLIVRFLDLEGELVGSFERPPARRELDRGATYIAWLGQKGKGPEQKNTLSFTRDRRLRGGNVATELHRGWTTFVSGGPRGLVASRLEHGPEIGREIGFGAIDPDLSPVGTPDSPFPFQGVARYDFFDERRGIVGGVTTNVMEGRRVDIDLGLSGQPTYRFGFFGPIVDGSGCFAGATGVFHGASGSVFNIPPAGQVVTHFYAARLDDPDGRYRASLGAGGGA